MRYLIFTRGAPGCGKSTFLRSRSLGAYAVSRDALRLVLQAPELVSSGLFSVSHKNEVKVNELIGQILENRMRNGDLTVMDATHSRAREINQYKALAEKYRYSAVVVDFSSVSLEVVLEQNKKRSEYQIVPEDHIVKMHKRIEASPTPDWVHCVSPKQFDSFFEEQIIVEGETFNDSVLRAPDQSARKKIHHIGDIQGCYSKLAAALRDLGGINEEALYIFTGNYFGKTDENALIADCLMDLSQKPNIVLLEGKRELSIWNRLYQGEESENHYLSEVLEQLEIKKESVKPLFHSLKSAFVYRFHDKIVSVSSGGVTKLPQSPILVSANQYIYGAGERDFDIDGAWDDFAEEDEYQIHGGRNPKLLDIQASARSVNLQGFPEDGGEIRTFTLV